MMIAELSVLVPCYNERANLAPLLAALDVALAGIAWEVVIIDDDSPDGTAAEARRLAQQDGRVRCLRRLGRRGLASAVIEGALSSSAAYVAVIDGDLQHDPQALPAMLALVRDGQADVAVGSRHVSGGDASGLGSSLRVRLSGLGTKLSEGFLAPHLAAGRLADPMSGFFLMPRPLFEQLAPRLTAQGFKILVDLLLSAPRPLRVAEVPYRFAPRAAGESKLDLLVLLQFIGLLFDKRTGGVVPLRFVSFALVGLVGLAVHLAVLTIARGGGVDFAWSQGMATIVAMAANFQLNNRITYATQRLRGPAFWRGLLLFMAVSAVGAVANIGIARVLYAEHGGWTPSGAIGAVIGLVWNYAVSATLVWRAR